MTTIPEALALALEHHQAGRLEAAEPIYRQILQADPTCSHAWNLLGVLAHQVNRGDVALGYLQQAIQLNPTDAAFHSNLAEVHRVCGRFAEAAACCRAALTLQPNHVGALNNLGVALFGQGNFQAALPAYQRALELEPMLVEAHDNLGKIYEALNRPLDAIASYREAIRLRPTFAEAHNNLAGPLKLLGDLENARKHYQEAIRLKPDFPEPYYNLGNILCEQGKLTEAIAYYESALRLKPDLYKAHNNLGNVLLTQAKLDEAVACYRRALDCKPDFLDALNNLIHVHEMQGDQNEAIACCRQALERRPDYAPLHSSLLYALHFGSDYDARTIAEEHRRWAERHAQPLAKLIQRHPNDKSAGRRLRIGYVSPGFDTGSTALFLLPLLEAHDHERFEIICYAAVRDADATTDRCRACADLWRDIVGMPDEQLAATIREDRIDILIDLSMHSLYNRLLVFARKPAPVQVTYLAYPGTTGLSTIDYRLTDGYLDPPGRLGPAGGDDTIYTEQSIRLPQTYWCYRPLIETPAVNDLPALRTGHITFGCLNNFCKATPETLAAWIGLLQAIPDATLVLHAQPGSHRERVWNLFAQQGVARERLTFARGMPIAEYLELYQQIDVALDPFPYGGGATTCDALWMGVPVVSLAGRTAVGRGGLSILSNVGLPELVARNTDGYIRIAVELAGDLPRLGELRATLRERMQNSPLMDAPRFARNIEAAYRDMWRRWCEK